MHTDGGGGATTPLWMDGVVVPTYAPLARDTYADVCVIGAGIAGLTTAYLLAREGRSVIVVDQGPVGGGETGRSTGHLTAVLQDRYVDLERLHGAERARLIAGSHTAAIDRIAAIVSAEDIDCGFGRVDGCLVAADGEGRDRLDREAAAMRRAGLAGVTVHDRGPAGWFVTRPCLTVPHQAQIDPVAYVTALAQAIVRDGGRIVSGTRAISVEGGMPARVGTAGGATVTAAAVVVATHTPINDVVTMHTKLAAYRTYVIGLKVRRGGRQPLLLWDTGRPEHYVRIRPAPDDRSPDVVLVGGEDHRTGQADDSAARFARLEAWALDRLHIAGVTDFRWSGQIVEPVDGLAYIGRNPGVVPNVYIATGDAGNGLTHGTIAGIVLTDLLADRASPWAALYDPSRRSVRASGEYLRENLNVVGRYARWLTPGAVPRVGDVAPGQGAVLRRGMQKIACYRDAAGVLHERSAVCPHLYCIVEWNSAERTWDCPCHGSRFAPDGRVINGPAVDDLPPVDEPEA